MSVLPMPFKKLNVKTKEILEDLDMTTPTPFQIKSIPVIKSGANVYCVSKPGSGKTFTLVLTTLQKIKFEAEGTSPRAFVLVETMEKASELYDMFLQFTRYSSVRVYVAHEKNHIDLQKSEIFEGVDILISTSKSLHKLFLLNGVSTSQVKILSIDDAGFLTQKQAYNEVLAITQSLPKCQYVLYTEKMEPALSRLQDYFMEFSKTVHN